MSEVKNVTITVPVGLNGWQQEGSVVINGMKVEFPVGVETEVPETAAALLKELIEAAEKRDEDTAKPNNHYVGAVTIPAGKNLTLEDGAGIKRADKVILPETALKPFSDIAFALESPFENTPVHGKKCTVIYNGTKYDCVAYDTGLALDGAETGEFAIGNMSLLFEQDVEFGNSDAPFAAILYPNGTILDDGDTRKYAMLVGTDGATSVTLSIVEKGGAVNVENGGGGAGFIVHTTLGEKVDDTTKQVTFDKTYEETVAAIKAGKHVACHVNDDGATVIAPALMVDSQQVIFTWSMNGLIIQIIMPVDGQGAMIQNE